MAIRELLEGFNLVSPIYDYIIYEKFIHDMCFNIIRAFHQNTKLFHQLFVFMIDLCDLVPADYEYNNEFKKLFIEHFRKSPRSGIEFIADNYNNSLYTMKHKLSWGAECEYILPETLYTAFRIDTIIKLTDIMGFALKDYNPYII